MLHRAASSRPLGKTNHSFARSAYTEVLESKLLLARDLLQQDPVPTELLKEVTEARLALIF